MTWNVAERGRRIAESLGVHRVRTLLAARLGIRKVRTLLAGLPTPIYLDVGAAGGMPYIWRRAVFSRTVRGVFIDLADEWGARPGSVEILKHGLAGTDGERDFYLTEHPGCSSILEPDESQLEPYPAAPWFKVVGKKRVFAYRYDTLAARLRLPSVDFVKMDVQGADGECLVAMGKHLDHVCAIETEVHLKQLYKGQMVFSELHDFLCSRGFILRDLRPQGPFGAELVEMNGYWSRRELDETQQRYVSAWDVLNGIRAPIQLPSPY